MPVRFCPNCGTRLVEGSRFCPRCGKELPSQAAAPPPPPPQEPVKRPPAKPKATQAPRPRPAPPPSPPAATPPDNKKAAAGGFSALFVVILIVVIIYSVYKTHPNNDSTTYDITPVATFHQATGASAYASKAAAIAAAMDYNNSVTRNFAVQLAAKYPGDYSIAQICQIWEYLYKNWKYVNDPAGPDYFASASESINNGLCGDCDDFAITMGALIEAIGGGTRVVSGFTSTEGHAWAEVYVGNINDTDCQDVLQSVARRYHTSPESHMDENGGVWLNLDWWANHPGGPFFQGSKYYLTYPNGHCYFGYFN